MKRRALKYLDYWVHKLGLANTALGFRICKAYDENLFKGFAPALRWLSGGNHAHE